MRLRFIFSEIALGLRRNLTMTISVVLVTFVSLTFVGVASLLQTQIGKMKDDWYGKVEVAAYLCPSHSSVPTCAAGAVTDAQKADIQAALDAPEVKPFIQQTFYESQAQAFTSFQKRFAGEFMASLATVDDMN